MADVVADAPPGVASGAPGARRGRDRAPVDAPLEPDQVEPRQATATAPASEAEPVGGCTQAQLRRFIKSRPYVPMHELRRRFELNGSFDDVSPISTDQGCVYVGLPRRESVFIAELLRGGDIGIELSHDPAVPIVVGVYAMRPVSR
jgi:hypothetical protein